MRALRLPLIQLIILMMLAALLLPAIGPRLVVAASPAIKLLFLGRMAVLLGLATLFLRLRGLGWVDVGLSLPRWRRFALGIGIGFVGVAAGVGLVGVILHIVGAARADYAMFAPLRGNLGEYLFWLLPVSLASAAFGEELLFRGFVLDALSRTIGRMRHAGELAIVSQAALFGLLHFYQGASGALTAGMIGLVLGIVWRVSGRNLWAGIAIHAILDCSSMTAIYLGALH